MTPKLFEGLNLTRLLLDQKLTQLFEFPQVAPNQKELAQRDLSGHLKVTDCRRRHTSHFCESGAGNLSSFAELEQVVSQLELDFSGRPQRWKSVGIQGEQIE